MNPDLKRFNGSVSELIEALRNKFPLHITRPQEVLKYLHSFDHRVKVHFGLLVVSLIFHAPGAKPPPLGGQLQRGLG